MKTDRPTSAAARAVVSERQTALWLIVVLLAVIATTLVMKSGATITAAYADTPMLGGRGIFAFTGQIDRDRYGLFMMDVDNSTVWAYEYLPSTRKLRLAFARSFTYDRYLEDYGLDEQTSPRLIGELLKTQRQRKERDAQAGADADAGDALSTSLPGLPTTQEPAAEDDPERR